MTSPMRWPDGTLVDPEPDNAPTTDNHAWRLSESPVWARIDHELKDRIIQRLRAL
ncbi:hypothetical protein A8926_6095 [Saccharopolyspora spinosa]|uniref:Uncharacterized protein n=2 Tax=Saccharopolyspora spinosa TaxID=60894 RepID=A0A2N3Y5C0_SACSN|nr:hypothetical protein A8926_6095 [Saccharopolyspora spinosa]